MCVIVCVRACDRLSVYVKVCMYVGNLCVNM